MVPRRQLTIGIISIVLAHATDPCSAVPSYVAYQNYYRKLHGLNDLAYDATIAGVAQAYVESIAPNGGPANACLVHSNSNYGENMAWQSGASPTADESYLSAVQNWYKEVENWDFSTSTGSGTTGHFTQVTWASSTKVGCGRTQGAQGTCTICNYDPAGNNGQYAANIKDCDTSVAFKCATYKACVPAAERCNGVTHQCSIGDDEWIGDSSYKSNNDDELNCVQVTATPACTNTDGTVANAASCTCNAGTCASWTCTPGPGVGATCLAGQFCKSLSSECSGAANAPSNAPSNAQTPTTLAPASPAPTPVDAGGGPTPTSAPTQASIITMSQTVTFSSALTAAQQETVRSTYETQLLSTFSTTAAGWVVTIDAARRADYELSSTGSTSDSSAFKAASESSSSSFKTELTSNLASAGVAATSVSDYSVSVSSSDGGSSGLSDAIVVVIVFSVLIVVGLLVATIVVFVCLKGHCGWGADSDVNTAAGTTKGGGEVDLKQGPASTLAGVGPKHDTGDISSDGAQHSAV